MRVRRELGLDQPIPVQYVIFLSNLAHGDFGRSIHFREPAFDQAGSKYVLPEKPPVPRSTVETRPSGETR